MPRQFICENCAYWKSNSSLEDGALAGHCHFNPPQVVVRTHTSSYWPQTVAGDWCGQHSALQAIHHEANLTNGHLIRSIRFLPDG